jgi:formylglycine-generating enzyme required for sulfatase activity
MSRTHWIFGGSMVLLVCTLFFGGGAARSAPGAGVDQNHASKDAGMATTTGKGATGPVQPQEAKKEGACPPGMSYLPAATFTMGSNDKKNKKYWLQAEDEPEWPWLDEPIHKVAINALCMDTTEVTVAAYRACMQSGKCEEPRKSNCSWHKPNVDDHPQDCVTWAQAAQFCQAVGKRLPTEEEWEYGARGTDGRRYPWGNQDPHSEIDSGGYREFCRIRPGDTPCPVGQFKKFASPFGLLDMVGNLAEWTSSDYCEPNRVCRKIVRGDGGPTLGEMRGAHRGQEPATSWSSIVGFRCALSP